ncbi:MAG: hypothetical protein IKO56_03575 [Alphaproteobacteria bacterium]|nr:hypothetical protein [Alphaproteobacteria bacterium]
MSKRKRALRSLSANECRAGIYAERFPSPAPKIEPTRVSVVFLNCGI